MKFSTAAITSFILMPLGVLASPVPEAAPAGVPGGIETRGEAPAPISVEDSKGQSEADLETRDIFARARAWCKIVNVEDHANCRSGPGTNYPTKFWAYKKVDYAFACYKKGTCVDGNCTWDKLVWNGGSCYVSGTLTDSRCSAAALGKC